MSKLTLDQIKSETVYFCNRQQSYCCIVASCWDDAAALIACKYDGDITDEFFLTEASCLMILEAGSHL